MTCVWLGYLCLEGKLVGVYVLRCFVVWCLLLIDVGLAWF